jgi:pyruvate dehydrogenase E2 component (dihydrolipoamide acetyltransferase)
VDAGNAKIRRILNMATEVKIPIPDQTTEEVRIVKWHMDPGAAVKKGEVVLEVETDKSVIEVESTGDGVLLAQLSEVDDMVPVGNTVAFIGEAGEKVEAPAKPAKAATAKPAAVDTPAVAAAPVAAAPVGAGVKASPVARKLAATLGIDLNGIAGTGPGGRITKDDVQAATAAPTAAPAVSAGPAITQAASAPAPVLQPGQRVKASPNAKRLARELGVDIRTVAGTGPEGRVVGKDVQAFAASGAPAPLPIGPASGQPVPGTVAPLTKMRRAIGKNLQTSFRDTPHFNVTMSIDMTRAMAARAKLNEGREKSGRVSVNDLVIKACAVSLERYPSVNSRMYEDRIEYLADINIGVAVAVPDGLIVPVLVKADKMSWYDMAAEAKRISSLARGGKIIGAGKGTFTVSNLGMFGVENFTAIINPPESAILAVGAVKNEVVAIDGGIGLRPMMKVTLCSDHRVVDGALAAEFLRWVKVYLEEQVA